MLESNTCAAAYVSGAGNGQTGGDTALSAADDACILGIECIKSADIAGVGGGSFVQINAFAACVGHGFDGYVGVGVNKTGGDPLTLCIYNFVTFGDSNIGADSGNLAVFNKNSTSFESTLSDSNYFTVFNSKHNIYSLCWMIYISVIFDE